MALLPPFENWALAVMALGLCLAVWHVLRYPRDAEAWTFCAVTLLCVTQFMAGGRML